MKNTQGEMDNMMLSAEHEEQEDKQSEEDGEEEKEESEDEDDKPEDGGDDEDVKPKAKPQGKKDGKVAPPAKAKNKKESDVLNLNNEVVKMRKEVKRVRALTIRKLTRQIVALKNKKGKEAVVEKNQRRAARLLEELHAMKELVPDLVTKTALQKNLSFDIVCKNPKSTISDRATARIASHPQFNKKIQAIKAAVKAFKDERRKGGKLAEREKVQTQPAEASRQPPVKTSERENEKKEEAIAATPRKAKDDEVKVMEDTDDAAVGKTEEEVCSDAPETPEPKSDEPVEIKTRDVKQTESTQVESQVAKKPPSPKPAAAEPQRTTDDDGDESDLESSGDEEEKEYFDDSTEERFRKQSSQSEESDDDDFFVGKVSKFRKKKPKAEGEEQKEEVKKGSEKPSDQLQSQLDELESRLKSKRKALQSVFCSSLGGAKAGRGGGPGRGRGRGGDRFRGPKGGGGPSREFSQQSKYQRGSESSSVSKYSKPCPEARHQESGEKGGRGRGRGRGRGDAFRQKDPRGFSHQAPRQVLHPSWEASKKRKEQQGQILAFQGKKIKFDDDD